MIYNNSVFVLSGEPHFLSYQTLRFLPQAFFFAKVWLSWQTPSTTSKGYTAKNLFSSLPQSKIGISEKFLAALPGFLP